MYLDVRRLLEEENNINGMHVATRSEPRRVEHPKFCGAVALIARVEFVAKLSES